MRRRAEQGEEGEDERQEAQEPRRSFEQPAWLPRLGIRAIVGLDHHAWPEPRLDAQEYQGDGEGDLLAGGRSERVLPDGPDQVFSLLQEGQGETGKQDQQEHERNAGCSIQHRQGLVPGLAGRRHHVTDDSRRSRAPPLSHRLRAPRLRLQPVHPQFHGAEVVVVPVLQVVGEDDDLSGVMEGVVSFLADTELLYPLVRVPHEAADQAEPGQLPHPGPDSEDVRGEIPVALWPAGDPGVAPSPAGPEEPGLAALGLADVDLLLVGRDFDRLRPAHTSHVRPPAFARGDASARLARHDRSFRTSRNRASFDQAGDRASDRAPRVNQLGQPRLSLSTHGSPAFYQAPSRLSVWASSGGAASSLKPTRSRGAS